MTGGLYAHGDDRPARPKRRVPPPPMDTGALRWGGGALALLVLLLVQIQAFEGKRLAQNVYARPLLEKFCAGLGCGLPPFKDAGNIRIESRSLSPVKGGGQALEFRLVIANRSVLPQAFPDIRLVLDQLGGQPQAERVFPPQEYLGDGWREGAALPVGQPLEIRLFLAKPAKEVGGFKIEFR